MKHLLLVTLAFFCWSILTAQQNYPPLPFKKDQLDISVGIGVMPVNIPNKGLFNLGGSFVNLDLGISKRVSIGLHFGQNEEEFYATNAHGLIEREAPHISTVKKKYVGGRIFGHLTSLIDWNPYGGFMLAYNYGEARPDKDSHRMLMTGIVGTRYHLTDHFGFLVEVGYDGESIARVGLNLRL